MAFINRQNRQPDINNEQGNKAFGRGLFANQNPDQLEKKAREQSSYKEQLQRQIKEKEDRKRKEEQKIRLEDEKFMREIEEINRKQNKQKEIEKNKQQGGIQNQAPSPQVAKKKEEKNEIKRPTVGQLEISWSQPDRRIQEYSRDDYESNYNGNGGSRSDNRIRPYLYEENSQFNQYYQERMRKHKESLNHKMDELFYHINSTKDNIRVEEELERIRQRLKGRQAYNSDDYVLDSKNDQHAGGSFEQYSKFYDVPKKSGAAGTARSPTNQSRMKSLDYQSESKYGFSSQSRAKVKTHYQQSIQEEEQEQRSNSRWGEKPGKANYLGNREAIDFQIEKTLGGIDQYLNSLKHHAN